MKASLNSNTAATLWKRAREYYAKRHLLLNSLLSILLLLLLLDEKVANVASRMISSSHIDSISTLTSILLNVFSIGGILVAAIWTYYTFIRGRTFVPRLNIGLELRERSMHSQRFVILRVKIENVGGSKATLWSERTFLEYGRVANGQLMYSDKEEYSLLDEHLDEEQYIFFEPGAVSTVDTCIPISSYSRDAGEPRVADVLRVKVIFIAGGTTFQEIAIFDIRGNNGGN